MIDLTPSSGIDKGHGIRLGWSPLDVGGNAITGKGANITVVINEEGEDSIQKTGGELSESPAGSYYYDHKTAGDGMATGYWTYDGPGNSDAVRQFKYYVRAVS